jgi:hypothetical protein
LNVLRMSVSSGSALQGIVERRSHLGQFSRLVAGAALHEGLEAAGGADAADRRRVVDSARSLRADR